MRQPNEKKIFTGNIVKRAKIFAQNLFLDRDGTRDEVGGNTGPPLLPEFVITNYFYSKNVPFAYKQVSSTPLELLEYRRRVLSDQQMAKQTTRIRNVPTPQQQRKSTLLSLSNKQWTRPYSGSRTNSIQRTQLRQGRHKTHKLFNNTLAKLPLLILEYGRTKIFKSLILYRLWNKKDTMRSVCVSINRLTQIKNGIISKKGYPNATQNYLHHHQL